MSLASVLIRLPAQPDRSGADAALAALAGVARVQAGLKPGNRFLVHYDPRVVSARALLDALRSRGLQPTFVGS